MNMSYRNEAAPSSDRDQPYGIQDDLARRLKCYMDRRATRPTHLLEISQPAISRLFSDPAEIGRGWCRRFVVSTAAPDLKELFDLEALQQIMAYGGLRVPELRMIRGRQSLHPERFAYDIPLGNHVGAGIVNTNGAWSEYEQGATLVLQGVRRYSRPIDAFAGALEAELLLPVDVACFATAEIGLGAPAHHDLHHIFVLQVEGSRLWRFGSTAAIPPKSHLDPASIKDADFNSSVTLCPGDSLYVPAGTLHIASPSPPGHSLHLTFSLRNAPTAGELLASLLSALLTKYGTDLVPVPEVLDVDFQRSESIDAVIRLARTILEGLTPTRFSDEIRGAMTTLLATDAKKQQL